MSAAAKRCPGDSDFLAFFSGEMDETKRDAFIDHVFFCRRCRPKFDALRALGREVEPILAGVPEVPMDEGEEEALREAAKDRLRDLKAAGRRAPGRRYRIGVRTLAWAAPALLAVVVAGYFLAVRGSGPSATRTAAGNELRPISPIGRLTAAPTVFSWQPIAGAESYFYKVIDEDLDVISSGDTTGTLFRLEDAVRLKLVRGKTYLWTVEARNNVNIPIGEGKTSFVIR